MGRKKLDLAGQTFGRWTVLEEAGKSKNGDTLFKCRCECGHVADVNGCDLKRGHSKGCRKCAAEENKLDLAGQTFGKWHVLGEAGKAKNGNTLWKCRCECGHVADVRGSDLKSGKSKGCRKCAGTEKLDAYDVEKEKQWAFNAYKLGAKERGIPFCLTEGKFLEIVENNCAYCGAAPTAKDGHLRHLNRSRKKHGIELMAAPEAYWKANGIDRVDSSKGYIEGNCVACCEMCNIMKLDYTKEDFVQHLITILTHNNFVITRKEDTHA